MPKFQKHTHHSGTGGRAVSGDISNGQLDPAEIAELFQRLESAAAELIISLGKNPPRKELISRLRRQCAAAATEMKRGGPYEILGNPRGAGPFARGVAGARVRVLRDLGDWA